MVRVSRAATMERFARAFARHALIAAPLRYRATGKLKSVASAGSSAGQRGWRMNRGASGVVDGSERLAADCPELVAEVGQDLVNESDARRQHRHDVAEPHRLEEDEAAPGEAKQLERHRHPETGRDAKGNATAGDAESAEPLGRDSSAIFAPSAVKPSSARWSDALWQPPAQPLLD